MSTFFCPKAADWRRYSFHCCLDEEVMRIADKAV
jgi:hypothetical protein